MKVGEKYDAILRNSIEWLKIDMRADMIIEKGLSVREQPKLSQLIGHCITAYLKLKKGRKENLSTFHLYKRFVCVVFTA